MQCDRKTLKNHRILEAIIRPLGTTTDLSRFLPQQVKTWHKRSRNMDAAILLPISCYFRRFVAGFADIATGTKHQNYSRGEFSNELRKKIVFDLSMYHYKFIKFVYCVLEKYAFILVHPSS